MKKSFRVLITSFILALSTTILLSCNNGNTPTPEENNNSQEISKSETIKQSDTTITKPANQWAFISYELSEFAGETVTINFSADMKVTNNTDSTVKLMWQIMHDPYPVLAEYEFQPGTTDFVTVSSANLEEETNKDISISSSDIIYLSTYNIDDTSKIQIELKNVKYTVTYSTVEENDGSVSWVDESVPSLKDTYKDLFDYIGFACEYGLKGEKEFATAKVQKGLKKHASTITAGNEFKPQYVLQWWGNTPKISGTFTASNGITIDTPVINNNFSTVDAFMETCKKNNLKLRGHVLVWHSQTDDSFFYEDYNTSNNLVDKATMTARQEWYIKTVLEHVKEWEKANNNGEHIIWAWDVVNEAVEDGSSSLRSSSKWYEIYKNDDFIVNAFRFANKYADSDVQLCYNDYNCTDSTKRQGMIKILKDIIAHESDADLPTRINAMGMQSHISVNTSTSSYQSALKDFLKLGLDVQVTELDIATESSYNPSTLADAYYDFFKLFIKNRKTETKNGISAITIWGLNDEATWLNTESQIKWHGNTTQYPLLFKLNSKGNYVIKDAFTKVIEAASTK